MKLGALGDVVRTCGLARWHAERGDTVWWLTGGEAATLLERCAHVHRIVRCDLDARGERQAWPEGGLDLVYSLEEDERAATLAGALHARRLVGVRADENGLDHDELTADWFGVGLLAARDARAIEEVDAAKRADRRSLPERMAGWVTALHPDLDPPPRTLPAPRLVPREEDWAAAAGLLAPARSYGGGAPLIGVAPGAGRRWPTKTLPAAVAVGAIAAARAVLDARLGSGGGHVVLLGGVDDAALLSESLEAAGDDAVTLVAPTTDPAAYAAVLASCDVVVTADSLPLHLARAVGTPVVAIFGPTSSWEIEGGEDIERIVPAATVGWDCVPCFKPACAAPLHCLSATTRDDIASALDRLIDRQGLGRTWFMTPTYSEVETIDAMLQRILDLGLTGTRILVVDDQSPDGTGDRVALRAAGDPRVDLLQRRSPRGRGLAGRDGFVAALVRGATRIVEMDADLSHRPEDAPALLELLDAGADLAVGSRRLAGASDRRDSRARGLISRAAAALVRWAVGAELSDPTSGYRAYTRRALERLDCETLRSQGPEIVEEIVLRARRAGLAVREAPITFDPRGGGRSKLSAGRLASVLLRVLAMRVRAW